MIQYSKIALKLALSFTEEMYIPTIYRKKSVRKTETIKSLESIIRKKFDLNVKHWENLLTTMVSKLDQNKALRYALITPIIEPDISSVVYCNDFIEFLKYLELRRDIENCDPEELGRLAMLHTAFQRKIEDAINPKIDEPKQIKLKNDRAQELMDKGEIVLQGVKLRFWKGHTQQSILLQMHWNKAKCKSELNNNTSGENGHVLFTGTMQVPRGEAEQYASNLGFKVHDNPSKNTDFIIVGADNVSPSKIARAIELIDEGCDIKIIDEIEFLEMVGDNLDIK